MSGAPRLSQRSKATPTSPQRVRGWRAPRCQRTQARPYVLRRDLGGLHSAPAVEPGPQRKGDIPKPMMHGMKKSDEAVLPLKAANKGTRTPAESPEGRASTKGNLRDQSTHRTQGRDGVSQAVERIRQAATRRPQERLTALLHHITTDALRCAFFDLKKTASAGVDELVWSEYEAGLDERLLNLHDRVHSGAYRALPSRRVEIPKPSRNFSGSATGSDRGAGRIMRLTPWPSG